MNPGNTITVFQFPNGPNITIYFSYHELNNKKHTTNIGNEIRLSDYLPFLFLLF